MRISDWSSDVCSSDLVAFPTFVATLDVSPPLTEGHQIEPVLSAAESRVLWRICVNESRIGEPLLRAADAAQLAAEAWNLGPDYRLPLPLDDTGFADVAPYTAGARAYQPQLYWPAVLDAPIAEPDV